MTPDVEPENLDALRDAIAWMRALLAEDNDAVRAIETRASAEDLLPGVVALFRFVVSDDAAIDTRLEWMQTWAAQL